MIARVNKKQCRVCKYYDEKRTKFIDGDKNKPNQHRSVFCNKAGRYIDYKEKCPIDKSGMKLYKVYCSKCGAYLISFYHDPKSKDKIADMIDLQITEHKDKDKPCALFAYRIREDGLLGLQCECGNDTRANKISNLEKSRFNGRSSKFKFDRKES